MSIILDKVSYVYSPGTAYEISALKNINLKIEDGQFIGLIGHTGSGKSTLIQHLNGLVKATSGGIYFHGQDIYDSDFDLKELRTRVGLVFQYPEHQLFETTIFDDVCFGPMNQGLKKNEAGLLDEPTAGLDPMGRDEILGLIEKMHREREMTVILVSHSMEDVAKYVGRIIVMNDGEVMYDGAPREVFSHYKQLEAVGLAAPQVTYLMHELADAGIGVDVAATTIEEAKESILKGFR